MFSDKLQAYAYIMMFLNLSVVLLNVSGIMSVSNEIAGFDMMTDMTNKVYEIQEKFESSSGLDYAVAIGLLAWNGVIIIIEFVIMIFTGLKPIFELFGISPLIYAPIIAVVDLVVMYDLGKIFRGNS